MLIGLGLLLLTGYIGGKVVSSVGLPPLIGMLTVGVLMGPYVLNILDSDLLLVSQDIRTFALIIILLRAGLGIKKEQIRKVGVIALKMSIIPCILEGFTVMGLAYYLLGFSFSEAGMLGFIIAAVSPAVVVPSMIDLKEKRYGEDKQIPTLLLTGTSIDDVIAITFFTFFVGLETQTGHTSLVKNLLSIPFNILVGILLGAVIAYVLVYIFNKRSKNHSEKLVLLLSLTIIFVKWGDYTGIASLLGVMTIGFLLLEKVPTQAQTFSTALNGLWFFLQILLFALVGSEVDITKALDAGLSGVLIIIIGLLARSLGVWLVTMNSGLDIKERFFV